MNHGWPLILVLKRTNTGLGLPTLKKEKSGCAAARGQSSAK